MPETQLDNRKPYLRILGYISRAALALLCTLGLALFTFDSLDADISGGTVFIMAAAVCTVLGVMLWTKRLFAVGAVVLLCVFFLFVGSYGGIFEVLYLTAIAAYNLWFRRLGELGYYGSEDRIVDISRRLKELELDEGRLVLLAAMLAVLVFGIISTVCTVRRARVVPYFGTAVVLAAIMIAIGACEDTRGHALILASLCGIVALSVYDGVYCSQKYISNELGANSKSPDARRETEHVLRVNSSLGGFTGISAALIALALLIVPMQISGPMADIPTVSNAVVKLENFFSAIAHGSGGSGIIFGDDAVSGVRRATAQRRIFSGKRIFEVHSDVNMPIYLRSWVGKDYLDDGWYTATEEQLTEYRSKFGGGFSHEYLTAELLRAIDPSLVATPNDGERLAYHPELGYVSTYVHIDKKAPTEALLYLPSYTDQKTRLLVYGSRDDKHARGYANYYDGIFSSADYVLVDDYTVLSHLQTTPSTDSILGISAFVEEYARQYELLREMRELIAAGGDEDDVRGFFDSAAGEVFGAEHRISDTCPLPSGEGTLAYRYAYAMSTAQRREVDALMDNLPLYYEFVYDSYLTGCEKFSSFEKLVGEIFGASGADLRQKAQSYTGRHEIVTAVIKYLSENMVYTVEPSEPSGMRPYSNAAETFLFDTREGYCVQYASAAVMLLRAAGIPARYAEGYVAHNFSASPKGDIAKYEVTVRDSSAHAWVEVYYDYYGWITYEATSSYVVGDSYDGIDVGADSTPDTEPTDTTDTEPLDTEPTDVTTADTSPTRPVTTDDNSGQTGTPPKRDVRVGVIAMVLVIALAAAGVVFIAYRGRTLEKKRLEIAEIARRGLVGERDRRDTAEYIGDEIMRLLSILRLVPDSGEMASAFAKRVDSVLGTLDGQAFAEVMPIMQKAEFSGEVSSDELASVASYYASLYGVTQEKVNPFMRAYIKYGAVFHK